MTADATAPQPWSWNQTTLLLYLQVQPRAARTEWAGLHENRIRLRLNAPPVEGKANKACIEWVAKSFSVPKSRVTVIRGQNARLKTVALDQPDPAHAEQILQRLLHPET